MVHSIENDETDDGVVSRIFYELLLRTREHKPLLDNDPAAIGAMLQEVQFACRVIGVRLVSGGVASDGVSLIVSAPPTLCADEIYRTIRRALVRRMVLKNPKLAKQAIWDRNYLVLSLTEPTPSVPHADLKRAFTTRRPKRKESVSK